MPTEAEFEFSDTAAMTCLLCARQFKTLDQLKRHNKESDLHKVGLHDSLHMYRRISQHAQRNFKDPNLRDVAREKAKTAKSKQELPKYRDRAAERRVILPVVGTASSAV